LRSALVGEKSQSISMIKASAIFGLTVEIYVL